MEIVDYLSETTNQIHTEEILLIKSRPNFLKGVSSQFFLQTRLIFQQNQFYL